MTSSVSRARSRRGARDRRMCVSSRMFAASAAVLSSAAVCLADAPVQGVATASGQPVANARITLFIPSLSFFREVRTGTDGAYSMSTVPTGQYSLGVAARGLEYQEVA